MIKFRKWGDDSMKRMEIVILMLLSLFIACPSYTYAATVRIADVGVYKLVQNMRSIIYDINKVKTNVAPVKINDATRAPYILNYSCL